MAGMSGAGKTTLLNILSGRGLLTVDTDCDDWVLADGAWDEPRMEQLLANHRDVVVSGAVSNQGHFYDRFEHVVLLSAPVEVLLRRVETRTTTPMGAEPDQRAEIVRYVATVEPLLRRGATLELDGRRSPGDCRRYRGTRPTAPERHRMRAASHLDLRLSAACRSSSLRRWRGKAARG